jgi:hypothetical protein
VPEGRNHLERVEGMLNNDYTVCKEHGIWIPKQHDGSYYCIECHYGFVSPDEVKERCELSLRIIRNAFGEPNVVD